MPREWARWRDRVRAVEPPMLDGLIAMLVTVSALATLIDHVNQVVETDSGRVRFVHPGVLGVGLLLMSTAAVGWRRRAPFAVLLITSAAAFAYYEGGYAPPPLPYGPLIALYAVAALWVPVRSMVAAAILVVGVVILFLTLHSPITDDQFVAYILSICVAWGFGCGIHLNRARVVLLEEKAVHLAREQEANARLAIEQERARIARELHDIVAHSVSVMVALSGGAQRAFQARPDEGLWALKSIESTGREAMTQMRGMLGLLQREPVDDEIDPEPGLDHLARLIARTGRAALPVDLVIRGEPRPLPPEVSVNVYRIVEESLTNALKHAAPAQAQVLLCYEPDVLRLSIRDSGDRGYEQPTAGHGLIGILQRVTLLGGRLTVGPIPSGGFEVCADVPLNGGPP